MKVISADSEKARHYHRRRWCALAVLSGSLLVVTIGNGAVNIALPILADKLNATTQDLQWAVAAYGLSLAGLLFTGGAVGDRYGRKNALLVGLALFLVASVFAALTSSLAALVASRAVMGVAAALLLPAALAIVVETFSDGERGTAISIWSSALGVGGALAPVASGWVLGNFPHQAVFVIAMPLVVVALAGGVVWVRPSADPQGAPIDVLGCGLSTCGIVLCVFAVIEAPRAGWTSVRTTGAMAVGVLFLVAFACWELRHREPMIDLRLFADPILRVGVLGTTFYFMSMQGVMFLTSQHLQVVEGRSPLFAGAMNVPWGAAVIMSAIASGWSVRRWGARAVVVAATGLVVGSSIVVALVLQAGAPLWTFVGAVLVFHVGFGLGTAPLTAAIMSGVPVRRAGGGGALNSSAREIGGAVGVAAMGTVAAFVYGRGVTPAPSGLDPVATDSLTSSVGQADSVLAQRSDGLAIEALSSAYRAFESGFAASMSVLVLAGIGVVVAARRLPGPAAQARGRRRLRRSKSAGAT